MSLQIICYMKTLTGLLPQQPWMPFFALQPDEDQYESGIYTPGEDDKEPLAMGIYIHHIKGMDREGDAELHMFSCTPDYERQHSVFLKTDHEIGKSLIKSTTVPENMKKIRSAWMRVM